MPVNAFFPDIDALKDIVGGAVESDLSVISLGPYFDEAAEEIIIPFIGKDLYDEMAALPSGTEQVKLIKHIRKTMAPFCLWIYYDISAVRLSEGGNKRVETETFKSPYKYNDKAWKESMRDRAYVNLESMMIFLDGSGTTFTNFTTTYKENNRQYFINTAADFRIAYGHTISRFTFEHIKTVMADMEEFAIKSSIGEDYFNELKTQITADTLNADNLVIMPLLRKAIAYFTIEEAKRKFLVTIEGPRVFIREALTSDSNLRELTPEMDRISATQYAERAFSNAYMTRLIAIMQAGKTDNKYTTFNTWYDALLETRANQLNGISNVNNLLPHELKTGCTPDTGIDSSFYV